MIDDLVKQLRAARESGDPWGAWHLALQAADRIEKLEAALREIVNKDTFGMDWAIRTARKALDAE